MKSVAEENDCCTKKAKSSGARIYGIANKNLCQFKESVPWLTRHLYSHYIQTNRPPQTIILNAQQIASIELEVTGEVSTETGKMSRKGGHPKGSTISNISAAATIVVEAKNCAVAEFH